MGSEEKFARFLAAVGDPDTLDAASCNRFNYECLLEEVRNMRADVTELKRTVNRILSDAQRRT